MQLGRSSNFLIANKTHCTTCVVIHMVGSGRIPMNDEELNLKSLIIEIRKLSVGLASLSGSADQCMLEEGFKPVDNQCFPSRSGLDRPLMWFPCFLHRYYL